MDASVVCLMQKLDYLFFFTNLNASVFLGLLQSFLQITFLSDRENMDIAFQNIRIYF